MAIAASSAPVRGQYLGALNSNVIPNLYDQTFSMQQLLVPNDAIYVTPISDRAYWPPHDDDDTATILSVIVINHSTSITHPKTLIDEGGTGVTAFTGLDPQVINAGGIYGRTRRGLTTGLTFLEYIFKDLLFALSPHSASHRNNPHNSINPTPLCSHVYHSCLNCNASNCLGSLSCRDDHNARSTNPLSNWFDFEFLVEFMLNW